MYYINWIIIYLMISDFHSYVISLGTAVALFSFSENKDSEFKVRSVYNYVYTFMYVL